MNAASPGPGAPGFYGKLPALGDFAARRLPTAFITPWDAFLQAGLAASRLRFGAAWTGHFLSAPVWRFLLAPGVLGAPGWIGILLPSVDRVGRYFPLTIAAPLPAQAFDARGMLRAAAAWFSAVETIALGALSPRVGPEALDAGLAGIAPLSLPRPAGAAPATPHTLWWTMGSEIAPECVLASDALPADDRFCALLDGRWQDHGWARDAHLSGVGV